LHQELEIEIRHADEKTSFVVVRGEVDISNAHLLGSQIMGYRRGEFIHVDLTGVRYMDSSGLKQLLAMHRLAAECEANLAVFIPENQALHRLFSTVGLTDVLPIVIMPSDDRPSTSPETQEPPAKPRS
jgi:anti-anti-sigma factor